MAQKIDDIAKSDLLAALNKLGTAKGIAFEYGESGYGNIPHQVGIYASVNGRTPAPVGTIIQGADFSLVLNVFPANHGLNTISLRWDNMPSGRLYHTFIDQYRADGLADNSDVKKAFNIILVWLKA